MDEETVKVVLACSFWEDLDVFKVDGLLGEELDSALDWEAALAETFLNWVLLVDLDLVPCLSHNFFFSSELHFLQSLSL